MLIRETRARRVALVVGEQRLTVGRAVLTRLCLSGIEHGNLLDEPTAKLMAEKGIYLTPTLAVHGVRPAITVYTFLRNLTFAYSATDYLEASLRHGNAARVSTREK